MLMFQTANLLQDHVKQYKQLQDDIFYLYDSNQHLYVGKKERNEAKQTFEQL